MSLRDLCSSCKCGLCCFTMGSPNKELSGINEDILSKYSDRLIKKDNTYLIKINFNIELIIDSLIQGSEQFYACGLLGFRINNNIVSELYCLIHPKILGVDYRPEVCKSQDYHDCEVNQLVIKEFTIYGKLFNINEDLKRAIN